MLIGAFAKRAGMSVDTVRYYVRRDLLRPATGTRGGRNPYQLFGAADLEAAAVIRTCQALGLRLGDIAAFLEDYRGGRLSDDVLVAYLRRQQERLRGKAAALERLTAFLDAKIDWIRAGKRGATPHVGDFMDAAGGPDGGERPTGTAEALAI